MYLIFPKKLLFCCSYFCHVGFKLRKPSKFLIFNTLRWLYSNSNDTAYRFQWHRLCKPIGIRLLSPLLLSLIPPPPLFYVSCLLLLLICLPDHAQSGPLPQSSDSPSSPPISYISPSGNSISPGMLPHPRHLSHLRQGGLGNSFEETVCSLKLRETIDNPTHADFVNPQADRISNLNSFKFPVLPAPGFHQETFNYSRCLRAQTILKSSKTVPIKQEKVPKIWNVASQQPSMKMNH
ncbi:unnamed protein product [Lactuca virosa]|uniref:Uncharacterized protein n=1 Tax=Lactuca virosa TaxID=75947 RepID=A0AAU9NU50_9ASTR|nr:unnamed protein product [Lactuca virosa]